MKGYSIIFAFIKKGTLFFFAWSSYSYIFRPDPHFKHWSIDRENIGIVAKSILFTSINAITPESPSKNRNYAVNRRKSVTLERSTNI